MSTLEIEVVEAFQSLGVTPEVAMRAAAALHKRDGERMSKTDASIVRIDARLGEMGKDISDLRTDVDLLKWMVGFALVILVTLLGKALIK